MILIPCEQGSEIWLEHRRGVPTASSFKRIMTTTKDKETGLYNAATQQNGYIAELIAEQCGGSLGKSFKSAAMHHGTETEAEARAWFEMEVGQSQRVGFILDDNRRFGCSPDSLCGEESGLELKCPQLHTHAKWLMRGEKIPSEHLAQVHGCMVVTGRKSWNFLAYPVPDKYNPDKKLLPLLVRAVWDAYTDAVQAEMERFWIKYQAALAKLTGG